MFSAEQLAAIKQTARKKKNQGELSVYEEVEYLRWHIDVPSYMDEKQLAVVKFCAEECKRQRSGEASVYDMVNAWDFAHDFVDIATSHNEFCVNAMHFHGFPNLTPEFIEHIGALVEPVDNRSGFRHCAVWVGSKEKPPWDSVPRLLAKLLESYYGPDAPLESCIQGNDAYQHANTMEDVFYLEYEEIHPFRDGNGRSGKILFNYLKGTLNNPQMPPNFWGIANP